jgi:hypothetical protein
LKCSLANDLYNGKRVCIAYSTGIDKMNGLCSSYGIPFININKHTKHKYTIEDWKKYQLVVYSPTMDAGVDVSFRDDDGDREAHFDVVYGLFNRDNTPPKVAVQMLGRVRDCSEYKLCLKGAYKGDVFYSQAEFKSILQTRLDLITSTGLHAFLSDDFVPQINIDFKYNVVWNVLSHRVESTTESYNKYLKYFLITNRWMIDVTFDCVEDQDVIDNIKLVERLGQISEKKMIAESRIVSSDEALIMDGLIDIESHRMLIAYSVMTAYAMDIDRPPPYKNKIRDFNLVTEWRHELQEDQYDKLFPFDSDNEQIGFDYIKDWRNNRRKLYRQMQLVDLNNGDEVRFVFLLHRKSFNETSHHVNLVLKALGFLTLQTVVPELNHARLQRSRYLRTIMRKKKVDKYLEDECGLFIRENPAGGYELYSNLVSADPRELYAFYLKDTPVPYESRFPEGFEPLGSRVKCRSCFRMVNNTYVLKHKCKRLPDGYRYVDIGIHGSRQCITCDEVIVRNLKRHRHQ